MSTQILHELSPNIIDCKSTDLATTFLNDLLQYGFADVGNFAGNVLDYSNDIGWR